MSRILKRPMFRKGGSANEGIMHRLVDRRGYANSNWEDIVADSPNIGKAYKAYSALEQPKDTSLYNMLIQGGLNLVSGAGAGGGTLSNIAKSYKEPSETFMEAQSARQAYPNKLKMAAIQSGLEQDWAMELARQKAMTSGKEFKDIKVAEELGKIIPQIYVLEEKLKKDPDNADLKIKLDVLRTKRRNFSKNNPVTEAALDIFAKSTTGQLMFNNLKEDLLKQDRIDGTNKYTGENDRALIADAIKELKNQLSEFSRSSNADGGRIGYNIGSPEPMQETSPVEENPISYDQLRSRLPQEITNDIVRLLSVSAEALEDFANISSQKDVDNFNKKYSVNLVLPSEA